MTIADHRLAGCWAGPTPNCGGPLIDPALIVLHFTASGGGDPAGDIAWFRNPQARASAHVVIGRDGTIRQLVPFDMRAWHAGPSIWRGRGDCNGWSIGIELDNWGRLTEAADGRLLSWTGAVVDRGRAGLLSHKQEKGPAYWELYPEAQLAAAADLVRVLAAAYPSIEEVVGHDDIAPGRKSDPGPALPMARFAGLVAGRDGGGVRERIVIAPRLNARGGGGTQFGIIGQFAEGTPVDVLYDSPGGWAQVKGRVAHGEIVTAWVADQYLR